MGRRIGFICSAFLACACGDGGKNAVDGGPDGGTPDSGAPDSGTPDTGPIAPALGAAGTVPVDCTGAYELPAELTGEDGLGHHGWTLDDLTLTLSWSLASRFDSAWISDNSNEAPSLRVRPWLVPEAGTCFRDDLVAGSGGAAAGEEVLGQVLAATTAFAHADSAYDGLERDEYSAPSYSLGGERILERAVQGLVELPNDFPGAPAAQWDAAAEEEIASLSAALTPAAREALARLVLAIGEAYLLKREALAGADADVWEKIFDGFHNAGYASINNSFASPSSGSALADIVASGDLAQLRPFYRAGLAVARAADSCRRELAATGPVDAPAVDLATPHGRIVIETAGGDTAYAAGDLEDAALAIDLGGADTYRGRYAATSELWMSASVLIDVAGDDGYGAGIPDIEAASTTTVQAFDKENGFTQGAALFGVALLIDAAGNDAYDASVYAQGNAVFGVGALQDLDGVDSYKLGTSGQGAGFFGIGLLLDAAGNDHYGVYTLGQGVGRAEGHGLLFDLAGDDTYIGYYAGGEPELPGEGYNNYYGLDSTWAYSSADGTPHYMSVAQGVGWGYRGDWFSDNTNWRGGFGALVDLGTGADVHYADCMAMGQGFVYGFGFLYDDGGDDTYRTFWWGPAAAAHMGVGLLIDEDGNDDTHVTRLSGGYGYDCSIGWLVDNGGDDTYAGQFNYGRAYTYGETFFVNDGGDDVYNAGAEQTDPMFGYVDWGFPGAQLAGIFLDLGGGADTYVTSVAGVVNDAEWYLAPVGTDVDPAFHKGVGIDR